MSKDELLGYFEGKTQEEWADEAGGVEVFPPGWHQFTVIKVDGPKPNKNNNGHLLEVHFEHHNGGKLRNWYNLSHPNDTAARIGRAELAKLYTSAGRKLEHGVAALPGSTVDLRLTVEESNYKTDSGEVKKGKNNNVKDSAKAGTKSRKKQQQPNSGQRTQAHVSDESGDPPW